MLYTTVNDKNMPNCGKNPDKQIVYNFLKLTKGHALLNFLLQHYTLPSDILPLTLQLYLWYFPFKVIYLDFAYTFWHNLAHFQSHQLAQRFQTSPTRVKEWEL
jgi:hypothetical protein